ncbi:MAG: efflux RND transporter periplasmic adaptor subunit [Bacteroidota bacterium]
MKSLIPTVLMVLLVFQACTEATPPAQQTEQKTSAVPVKIESLMRDDAPSKVMASGMVASKEEIRLAFKIGGVISAVYVQEGSRVKKGQLLARLDPQEINAQVAQAEANLEKYQRDLDRVTRLYKDTVATLEQVENLTTAVDVAKSQLEIAAFNKNHAAIYAPTSGRILKRFAEKGEIIGPGNPVYFLAADRSAQVLRLGLSDVDVVKLKLGDPADVQLDAWPGQRFQAQVSEIAAGSDPMSGTFEVELSLKTEGKSVKNGFIGKATIFPRLTANRIRVPMSAMIEANSEKVLLYVPNEAGDGVEEISISSYEIADEYLSVPVEELRGVRYVITEGARYVDKENPIRIVNQPSDSPFVARN